MYFAQTRVDFNAPLYISMFNSLMEGRGDSYRSEIDSVLVEAKKVYNGEKEIYSISNDYFNLVSLLVSKGESLFADFNESEIKSSDYQGVLNVLADSQTTVSDES
ncbi:MAG: hypothetical protein NXI10_02755 [bacterium]|nr:hypothetical protein [bacterium]